jgi:hypothetical protein
MLFALVKSGLSMRLFEFLNTKVDYKIKCETDKAFATEAIIGKRKIVFDAHESDPEWNTWEIEFTEIAVSETGSDTSRSTYALTGSGNEFRVFSMVKDSILELITKYKPGEILFRAVREYDGSNTRADVYLKMLSKFKPPGYKVISSVYSSYTLFTMRRVEDQ